MRLKRLAIGLVLIFLGFLLVSVSQAPVMTENKKTEIIAEGAKNSAEINATLNTGDEFTMSYTGGSRYANPEEMDVVIQNPINESATFPYMIVGQKGIVANHTGLYKMQLLGLFVDPEQPFILTVKKIHRETDTWYPNSDVLPMGMSTIIIGMGVFFWGATSSASKRVRVKGHKT